MCVPSDSNEKDDESSFFEFLLYLLLVLIALISLLAYLRPSWFGLQRVIDLAGTPVAELWRETGQVRHKSRGSLVWHDLFKQKAQVSLGDTVYTGADGIARVHFQSGIQAELGPNSLVTFVKSEEASSGWLSWKRHDSQTEAINIIRGGFKIQNQPPARPLVIEAQGKQYRLEPTARADTLFPLNVNLSSTSSRSAELQISSDSGKDFRVIPVGASAVEPIEVHGFRPLVIKLSEIPKSETAEKLPQTTNSTDFERQNDFDKNWNLPAFSTAPVKVETRIYLEEEVHHLPVKIQWETIPDANYVIQIFKNNLPWISQSNLKQAFFQFSLESLDFDQLSYQVTAKLSSGEEILSEALPIEIDYESPIVKIFSGKIKKGKNLMISWQRTALTSEYQIQVSTDPNFSKIEMDYIAPQNLAFFRAKTQGSIFIRVKSLSGERQSPWSAVKEVTVE